MAWAIIIAIRILVPLTILRWNLLGSILAIIADNLDVVILDLLGVRDFRYYDRVDKTLDTYFYLIQGYTLFFWNNKLARNIGISLLIYRLIGFVMYMITDLQMLLFVFANVFEFFYMYYLIYKKIFHKEPFEKLLDALPTLSVLLLFKLLQEYMLHVAQFPIYQWIKENIFSIST